MNFVRSRYVSRPYSTDIGSYTFRADVDSLKDQLRSLGATQVVTYDELEDKSLRDTVKKWTDGKVCIINPEYEI